MNSVCSLPVSPNHVLAITRGRSQDTSGSRYRSRSINSLDVSFAKHYPALRTFLYLFFPYSFLLVRIPFLVGNWRQRWNRSQQRHGNRFHISNYVIVTIKLDDTFFSSLLPVLSIYARSSRRRTETRTDRATAAPLVCIRRFPSSFSQCSRFERFEEIFRFPLNRVDNQFR